MPPGKNMDDFYTILRSGMWRLNYKLTTEGRARFFNEFLPLLGDSKTRVMGARDADSWYLVYIGTKASARGKGYAKSLITHVTSLADAGGKACYLESSNDVNPRIYAKYGFEIQKKVYLQRGEEHVELDLMVREPKLPVPAEGATVKKRDSFLEKESEMRSEAV
jgi:ribosomal protein S18 acetylase RimI-like enzyme